jgi:CRP/FNR family transcriptional regulator
MATEDRSWLAHFPVLAHLPEDRREELRRAGQVVTLPAGSRIFGPGQSPQSYLLMLDGSVRVQQVSETGREIVLYRVSAGQSCALTTACLMGYEDYPAEAVAETEVRAVTIPRATFDALVAASPEFRRFVFASFSRTVTDLCRVIDDVAFARLDLRLAQKLIELSAGGDRLAVTQAQLAAELGSAREVVGRTLSEFQKRGWIAQARGSLTLLDRAALERLATTS